jgi:hypothetical protein
MDGSSQVTLSHSSNTLRVFLPLSFKNVSVISEVVTSMTVALKARFEIPDDEPIYLSPMFLELIWLAR